MSLFRLIYRSETNFPVSPTERQSTGAKDALRKILEASARHNGERGITGALIFDWDRFLQILEGDTDRVNQTYGAIVRDPRHKHVCLVEAGAVDSRAFPTWTMIHRDDKPDTRAVLARYTADGVFRPEQCSARALIGLCQDLIQLKGGIASNQVSVAA